MRIFETSKGLSFLPPEMVRGIFKGRKVTDIYVDKNGKISAIELDNAIVVSLCTTEDDPNEDYHPGIIVYMVSDLSLSKEDDRP